MRAKAVGRPSRANGITAMWPDNANPRGSQMKRWIIALAAAATAAAALPAAYAQDTGNWIVRGRAVNLDSANKDSTGLDLSVNNKVIPEVDITWFFSPNVAAELILTYPQKHDVKAGGTKIGSLKHLPPTITAQYHFAHLGSLRPYVGGGLNITLFSGVDLPAGVTIKKSSFGLALQAGVDVPMGGG
jgi:outer membrane protein